MQSPPGWSTGVRESRVRGGGPGLSGDPVPQRVVCEVRPVLTPAHPLKWQTLPRGPLAAPLAPPTSRLPASRFFPALRFSAVRFLCLLSSEITDMWRVGW